MSRALTRLRCGRGLMDLLSARALLLTLTHPFCAARFSSEDALHAHALCCTRCAHPVRTWSSSDGGNPRAPVVPPHSPLCSAAHLRVLVLDAVDLQQRLPNGPSWGPEATAGDSAPAWLRALGEHAGTSSGADLVVLNKSDAVGAWSAWTAGADGREGELESAPERAAGAAMDAIRAGEAASPPAAFLGSVHDLLQRALSLRFGGATGAGGSGSGLNAHPSAPITGLHGGGGNGDGGRAGHWVAANTHVVSCKTGAGMEELCTALRAAAAGVLDAGAGSSGAGGAAVTRLRHRQHLAEAVAALERRAAGHALVCHNAFVMCVDVRTVVTHHSPHMREEHDREHHLERKGRMLKP